MTTNDTRERVIEQIARKVRPHAFYEPEQYRRWANRPVSDYEWHTLIPNALRFSEEVLTLVEATAPDHQAEALELRAQMNAASRELERRDAWLRQWIENAEGGGVDADDLAALREWFDGTDTTPDCICYSTRSSRCRAHDEPTPADHQAEAPSEAVQALIDAADALTPDEVHDHPFAALDKVRGLTRELRAALAARPVVDDAAAKLRQAISWADDDSEAGGGIVLGGIAIREAAEGLLAALGGDQ